MLCVFQTSSVEKFVLPQATDEILTSKNFTNTQEDEFSNYADESIRFQEYNTS